jgi:hypothetical protein
VLAAGSINGSANLTDAPLLEVYDFIEQTVVGITAGDARVTIEFDGGGHLNGIVEIRPTSGHSLAWNRGRFAAVRYPV